MRAQEIVVCSFAAVFLLLVCYDVTQQLSHNRSLSASFYHEINKVFRGNCRLNKTDCCFSEFLRLLEDRKGTGEYLFVEPDPPISIKRVPPKCRKHLIPPSSSLSKEIVRCYSHQFVTNETRTRVRTGLYIVKKLFDDNKIPLIVAGGSLLGSLRYHGMIPYDDDFDFRIPKDKSWQIKQLLENLCKTDKRFSCKLQLTMMDHYQLLIGILDPKKKDYASFIDFFFYQVRGDKIVTTDGVKSYPKSVLFPLTKRPLEGKLFDFPRDARTYQKLLYSRYDPNECHAYDHRGKQRKGCQRVPCSALDSFLPFLVSSESSQGRLEIVVKGSFVSSIFFHRNISQM